MRESDRQPGPGFPGTLGGPDGLVGGGENALGATTAVDWVPEDDATEWEDLSEESQCAVLRAVDFLRATRTRRAPHEEARWRAIWELFPVAPAARPALSVLVDALRDSSQLVRDSAALVLGRLRPPAVEAVPRLSQVLAELEDDEEGLALVEALGLIGPPARSAALELELRATSRNELVRVEVALALGRVGADDGTGLVTLLRLVDDLCVRVQLAALEALGRFGPRAARAVPSLVEHLFAEEEAVQAEAARSLGLVGPPAVTAGPQLVGLAAAEPRIVQSAALAALVRLGCDRTGALRTLTGWLDSADPAQRQAAAEALCEIGPAAAAAAPRLLARLLEVLSGPAVPAAERLALSRAAWSIAADATIAFQGALGVLDAPEHDLWPGAARLVCEIARADDAFQPALAGLVDAPDAFVRRIVRRTLRHAQGGPSSSPPGP